MRRQGAASKSRLRGGAHRLPSPDMSLTSDLADSHDTFAPRHLGDNPDDTAAMLKLLGYPTVDALVAAAVPAAIRRGPLRTPSAAGESAALEELGRIAAANRVLRSCIGQGYHDTITPPVIQRTIFENPGWYTAYTPYQSEISQGRLEALLNFQTLVCDMTTLAVLWPTPGNSSRPSKVSGTSPRCLSTMIRESSEIARAFCGESPQGRMIRWMSATGTRIIAAGVSARAKSAGVVWFTRLSVHRAERTTATRSVKASRCTSGIGVSG